MKVFVLGHKGMLGHLVAQFLRENGVTVVTSETRYGGTAGDQLIGEVVDADCQWVINAIGKIPQKTDSAHALYQINSLFPTHLALRLGKGTRLLHASTDCVYCGQHAPYAVDQTPDATDTYGQSKALGEVIADLDRVTIVRCSIIGPEAGTANGLFSWFLNQVAPIQGFTNQIWSGITTLEWAKLCLEILQENSPPRMVQPGIPQPLSKFELLQKINALWERGTKVRPGEGTPKDMTLIPSRPRPELQIQLEELKAWMAAHPTHATEERAT